MTRTFVGVLLAIAALAILLSVGWAQKPAAGTPPATAPEPANPIRVDEQGDPFGVRDAPALVRPKAEPTRKPTETAAAASSSPTPSALAAPPLSAVPAGVTQTPHVVWEVTPTPGTAVAPAPAGGIIMGGGGAGTSGYAAGTGGVSGVEAYPMPGTATVIGLPAAYRGYANSEKLYAEIQKAQQEQQALMGKYAATANEQERTKLKESLSKVLDRQFDLQQQWRKQELEPIEARIKRLRELIDKRNQARKMIVEKRLDQLLREAEGMGWTPPGETTSAVPPAPSFGPSTYYQSPPVYNGGAYKKAEPVPLPVLSSTGGGYVVREGRSSMWPATAHTSGAPQTEIKIISFGRLDGSSLVEKISAFPPVKEKRVQIEFDKAANIVAVSGPKEDVRIFQDLLGRLAEDESKVSKNDKSEPKGGSKAEEPKARF